MTVYEYYPFYNPSIPFGKELCILRKDLNVTQKELSVITGIPYHDIRSWEQGYRTPKKHLQPLILKYILDLIQIKIQNNSDIDTRS